MRPAAACAFILTAALLLQGCVGTAIGAAGSVVGAGIEVTGKTVGAAKDVVFFAPADGADRR